MRTAAGTRSVARATDKDRLLAKVNKNGPAVSEELGACWLWTASVRVDGYGQFWHENRQDTAHRAAYAIFNGPIGEGLLVLHRCDVPTCVRPEHLFLGSQQDNMRDMAAKGRARESKKTHCPRGHAYSVENTRVTKQGSRACRTCKRERDRRHWAERRVPKPALN